MTTWTDVHTHLNMLDQSPEKTIEAALSVGVEKLITIGTEPKDHQTVLDLANQFSPHVYCTLGVHPHEAKLFDDNVSDFLKENLNHPRVVAVGEIGLDFYYEHSEREVQKRAFRRQMELAIEAQLPVEIHTRDAEEDTIQILDEYKGQVGGLLHCFTGTQWLAKEAIERGFDISISGVVTFKKAESLRQTVAQLPSDRIHIETDAPFLAPSPHRGKKNRPEFLVHTAELVAGLHNLDLDALSQQLQANLFRRFPRIQPN